MKLLGGRAAIAVALLLLAVTGCNSDALPPAAGYTTVTGTVADATTNAPIPGAIVTIDTVLTATTDAAGHYSIDKVPSGIVDYAVAAKGYATLNATANAEPGKPFTLNLTLAQAPSH
ncbi:MAG: carboxypeptidase regulatory-like domain-containing protein [Candidatus Eremiobacteraeota bacterium]|nr:carboxypeptidase regulatory-like domain-containing protein [Candidatus Eremiobacteraeota bacterium]